MNFYTDDEIRQMIMNSISREDGHLKEDVHKLKIRVDILEKEIEYLKQTLESIGGRII